MCPGCASATFVDETPAVNSPLAVLVADAQSTNLRSSDPAAPASSPIPEPDDEGPLYVARKKVYPQRVKGTFRSIKWVVLCVTLGI